MMITFPYSRATKIKIFFQVLGKKNVYKLTVFFYDVNLGMQCFDVTRCLSRAS